jgi:two-component system sensor histidine kinase KdpD
VRGRRLPAHDRGLLEAFAAHAAAVLEFQRLSLRAREAVELQHGNAIRTALLAAVSHDLRTPLAMIKAAVSSLRQPDVEFAPEDIAELLAAIEDGADRLAGLISNLLDVSRLQSGVITPKLVEVALDEVVPRALETLPSDRIVLDIDESLPMVTTDVGLLERIVVNVVQNALTHSASSQPVVVSASTRSGRLGVAGGERAVVELRVIDRGRGVPDQAKQRMFAAFQRLGDAPAGTGVGLGLAVARGFAEALSGSLEAEDTPGGGLTMVLTFPA